MIVDQQIAEMDEEIHERFLKELDVAKATGNIETIQAFFAKNDSKEERNGYDLIFVSDDDLDKILENKKCLKNDLYYSKTYNALNNNGLIVEYREIKDEYGRKIFVYYIHAIYLHNFFKKTSE